MLANEGVCLRPQHNSTATEAAEQITAQASDRRRQPPNNRVGKIWNLLLACAEEVPNAQPQILNLFNAIFSLPKPEGKNGWDVDWSNEKQREGLGWTLEGLHSCMFLAFPGSEIGKMVGLTMMMKALKSNIQEKSSSSASGVSLKDRWANFHAFTARAESVGIMYSNITWAIPLIVSTLEKKVATKDTKSKQVVSLETNVPAATNWLIFASEELLMGADKIEKGCFEGSEFGEWKGTGFSRERWSFWKQRLEELATSELLSEEAKEAVRKAAVSMAKAERVKK